MTEFRQELESLINRHSMENGSNTPDFILANYLSDMLDAFDRTVRDREAWYGRESRPYEFERQEGLNVFGQHPEGT